VYPGLRSHGVHSRLASFLNFCVLKYRYKVALSERNIRYPQLEDHGTAHPTFREGRVSEFLGEISGF
jgi:hypothetical protein